MRASPIPLYTCRVAHARVLAPCYLAPLSVGLAEAAAALGTWNR